jgi:nucleoside-diphosphate-sugar epimerase
LLVRLTIFGATGPTGRRLLERAIAEGHEVTAFARDPSRLKAQHERLRVVRGDAFDAADVEGAVADAEAVISVLGGEPSNPLRPSRSGDRNGPGSAGARHIVAAMKEHGIRYRAAEDLKPGRRFWISRADVADFLMRQLFDDAFVRRTAAIAY